MTETAQLLRIMTFVVVVASLYFGRSVFIPLAMALLLSLLIAPVMSILAKIHMPRAMGILLIAVALASIALALAWKLSSEFVDFANRLPTYKQTLDDKIRALGGFQNSNFSRVSQVFGDLETELLNVSSNVGDQDRGVKRPALGASLTRPMAVQIVPASNRVGSVESILGWLEWLGLIIIFAIAILMGREDLRNRFIHLSSGGRLTVVTQALDEATKRIQRYLFLQSAVNIIYGLIIGLGLYFIGLPDAWLWGLIAAILRFLPYLGSPLSAAIPVLLSLAIFPGWAHAVGTLVFYLVFEFAVSNFIEPRLYGAQVGLSTFAILVAAVFWSLIWGFPGLILATPLTVSLVVIGRYVPSLSFLKILLGDEPEISQSNLYYQRLLASDQIEARQVLDRFLKDKPLNELYSEILIPALSLIEEDRHRNELDEATLSFIMQSTRELIEELTDASSPAPNFEEAAEGKARGIVICVPARDEADEIVGMLLSESLQRAGLQSDSLPLSSVSDVLHSIADAKPDLVCISALPPFAIEHTRKLYEKLRSKFPELNLLICLWHYGGDIEKAHRRMKLIERHAIQVSLSAAIHSATDILQSSVKGSITAVSVEVGELTEEQASKSIVNANDGRSTASS